PAQPAALRGRAWLLPHVTEWHLGHALAAWTKKKEHWPLWQALGTEVLMRPVPAPGSRSSKPGDRFHREIAKTSQLPPEPVTIISIGEQMSTGWIRACRSCGCLLPSQIGSPRGHKMAASTTRLHGSTLSCRSEAVNFAVERPTVRTQTPTELTLSSVSTVSWPVTLGT
ncbi:hypothetical protein H1C71_021352, partial [Ictidomys tridecemlineatus]